MFSKLNLTVLFILNLTLSTAVTCLGQGMSTLEINDKSIDLNAFKVKVEKMLVDVGVPGMSFAIIDDNEVVFTEAYGYKDIFRKEKVNTETIFEACSLSKSFLVLTAFQLVDEGKLDLDKPLCDYLIHEKLSYDPRYKEITARMVLSHSSGIENWIYNNERGKLELLSNPGEAYVYSGEGYQYLARVIAAIEDESYTEYTGKRVLSSLGLQHTYLNYEIRTVLPNYSAYPENYAIGHDAFGNPLNKWKNSYTRPASGNHTTAEDYAKLIIAIFGEENLSKDRTKDLLEPIIQIEDINSSVFYGPGFEVIQANNDVIISHGGSNGGFKAMLFYSTARKDGFVFFTNSDVGKSMAAMLNAETVDLDISEKFKVDYQQQFPSATHTLFKVFREEGEAAMFDRLEELIKNNKLEEHSLNELSDIFKSKDKLWADFYFSETSFKKLRDDGLPGEMVDHLFSMKDVKFKGVEGFFVQIENIIGFDAADAYKGSLYTHAEKIPLNPDDSHLEIGIRLLLKNTALFPKSALAHSLLGSLYKKTDQYELALQSFQKAEELNFERWEIQGDIEDCKLELAKNKD